MGRILNIERIIGLVDELVKFEEVNIEPSILGGHPPLLPPPLLWHYMIIQLNQ
jgi:hypothetical protein